jgi:hypothetical protein
LDSDSGGSRGRYGGCAMDAGGMLCFGELSNLSSSACSTFCSSKSIAFSDLTENSPYSKSLLCWFSVIGGAAFGGEPDYTGLRSDYGDSMYDGGWLKAFRDVWLSSSRCSGVSGRKASSSGSSYSFMVSIYSFKSLFFAVRSPIYFVNRSTANLCLDSLTFISSKTVFTYFLSSSICCRSFFVGKV